MTKINILFFLWLTYLSFAGVKAQEVPSQIRFVTIKSPHFDVIINARQQGLGQYYANQLEKIYTFTHSFITDHPEKTVVIINDKWDITNGYATRVPYPQIMIYPVLPGPGESLSETGDWTLELLAHEYTHILTFEPATGFVKYLRPLFGSIMAPNILLPAWWKEGVAVQVESLISTGGRLRSSYQDATLRAMVLSDKLWSHDLAKINEVLPSWPEGMRPYLFGSILWSQMATDGGGPKTVDHFFQRQSGRFPYFIETPAEDYLGNSYSEEYKKSLIATETRAKKQIETLRLQAVTQDQPLTIPSAEYSSAPSISANGQWLALITKDFIDQRGLQIISRNKDTNDFINGKLISAETNTEDNTHSKVFDGPPTGSISRVSWFHKSDKIIYDKIDAVNSIEKYSDLYVYDLNTKKTIKLTKKLRAREPAISESDSKVAYVQLGPNQTGLGLIDLTTRKIQILVPGKNNQRISHPVFHGDEKIIFSMTDGAEVEDLWQYDLSTKKYEKVTQQLPRARFAEVSQENIFFTSNQNGAHNIFVQPLQTKNPQPISNTLTSFLSFTVDPLTSDIYATKMTEAGPWVVKIPKNETQARTDLPKIEPLFGDRYPARQAGAATTENYPVENYRVGNSLWPKYWIPFFASTSNGFLFQALTSGFDPLKKHEYSLAAIWDSYLNKGSFSGNYTNNVWSIPWFLQSSVTNSYFASANNLQTTSTYAAGMAPSLFNWNRYLSTSLSLKYQNISSDTTQYKRLGPSASLMYSDLSEGGEQISPENTKALYIGGSFFMGSGDYLNHQQYLASASYYFSKWIPRRHVIMAKVSGVYTPQKISNTLGASTGSLILNPDVPTPDFTMRGYLPGHFVGRNMINTNLEYRFPIRNIERGAGTDPFYLRRLHGALIMDGVSTEGAAYSTVTQSYFAKTLADKFWSFGGELRLETTIGYVLPVNFVVYYYIPQNKDFGGSSSSGLSLQITQSF